MLFRTGWIPSLFDGRDYYLSHEKAMTKLKAVAPTGDFEVDLRPDASPIEDQGDLGSCTAHAVIGLVEYLHKVREGKHVDLSRLFLYRITRRMMYPGNLAPGDTGADIRTTVKALRRFGSPPEKVWPYRVSDFDKEPSWFEGNWAQTYQALYYVTLNGLEQVKAVLRHGFPVAFGFTCYSSIDDVGSDGMIPYPDFTKEKVEGGHAVAAFGYHEQSKVLIIRNSWGVGWGDGGYGYLPYDYWSGTWPLAMQPFAVLRVAYDEE